MKTPLLSILIPTTPARVVSLLVPLYEKLLQQCAALEDRAEVELLAFLDNRMRTIGEKRDALVQMSRGRYVAFVDDDDDVDAAYVAELVAAIKTHNVDVITFKQRAEIDGVAGICHFSIQHPNEPFNTSGFRRNAWHVCAWHGDLARRFRFPASNYGEDWAWARHLVVEAKSEHHIDRVLHTYRYRAEVSEAPKPAAVPITCYDDIPGTFDYPDFYRDVVAAAPPKATFVELGTFLGKSAAFMMLAIRESGKDINFTSFDCYLPMPVHDEEEREMIARHGSQEAAARACFTAATGLPSERFLIRSDSADASLRYADCSVDFCFIDADHSEEAAKRDIAAWLPKMKPGGLIAGHDIDFHPVREAVLSCFTIDRVRSVGRCWFVPIPKVDTPAQNAVLA